MSHRLTNHGVVSVCLAIGFFAQIVRAQELDSAASHAKSLSRAVEQKPIGSTQEVVVLRAGERIRRQVKMVALPDEL